MAPLPPRPLKGSRMDYCLPRRSREAVLTIIHQPRLTLRKHRHLAGTGCAPCSPAQGSLSTVAFIWPLVALLGTSKCSLSRMAVLPL